MTPQERAEKWSKHINIKIPQSEYQFLLLGIDFKETDAFKEQAAHLHKGKVTKRQEEMRKKPRIDVEPPAVGGGRTPQLLDKDMPQDAVEGMFLRQEIASSSNHAPGWVRFPESQHYSQAILTEAPQDGPKQSLYSRASSSGSKMLPNIESEWEDLEDIRDVNPEEAVHSQVRKDRKTYDYLEKEKRER